MMLQALTAYAERRIAEDPEFFDPDFRWEKAAWQVELSKAGVLNGLIPLKTRVGKRWEQKKVRRPYTDVNEISVRSLAKAKAYFLCDTLQRVFLFDGPNKVSDDPLVLARKKYFQNLIQRAADARVAAELLRPIVSFLQNDSELSRLRQRLGEEGAAPGENVVFAVEGVEPIENSEVQAFWRQEKREAFSGQGHKALCLVTGVLSDCVSTANKIKGIGSQDTILISANEAAFCSFGLEKAENSAISARAEGLIKAALDELIAKSRAQGLVFNDTFCLHWTRKRVESDPVDLLARENLNPEAVAQLLKSVETGSQVAGIDAIAYYAVSISGNGARIVVRDWIESTVLEIRNHVGRWFLDIGIVEPGGVNVKREFSLGQLLRALANPKLETPFDALPHGAAEELLRSALTGGPVPQNILMASLRRETVDRVSGGDEAGQRKRFLPARFALIKLCLLRSPDRKENHTMTEKLDPNSKDVAYLCGQLFAVLGRLQLLALGKVGASIAERTYGGVATRPATTLGPLFTKVPAYLKKANDRFPGAGTNKQKEIESLCQRIEAQAGLPQTLGLEEQGRFALGYYCQLAEYRARREEAEIEQRAEQMIDENL
jgi:CRISPR-associated protein Csd1